MQILLDLSLFLDCGNEVLQVLLGLANEGLHSGFLS